MVQIKGDFKGLIITGGLTLADNGDFGFVFPVDRLGHPDHGVADDLATA